MATAKPDPRAALPHRLARRGHRLTGPRRAVLEVFAGSTEPLTVAEVHARLASGRADLVSVYRTVKLMVQVGLLRATDSTKGGVRYELGEEFTGHHHHLICQACGRIEDLDGCLLADEVLARLQQRVRQQKRFRVTEHELRLFGLCARCDGGRERIADARG
jgi:Fur family ferric uptake transcriptional regulator